MSILSTIRSALGRLGEGPPTAAPDLVVGPNGSGLVVAVRDGYTLSHLPPAVRYRPAHRFQDIASFAAWTARHAPVAEKAHIMVNEDSAGLEYLATDAGRLTAECMLRRHPRFERWWDVLDKQLTQQEAYRLFVTGRDDTDMATTKDGKPVHRVGQEIAGQLQKLKVARDGKFEVELDENGNYRGVAASDAVTVSARIPAEFELRVPIFDGVTLLLPIEDGAEVGAEVEATYRLHVFIDVVTPKDKPPVFVLRCPDLPVVINQAVRDAAAMLDRELRRNTPDGRQIYLVGIGDLQTHATTVVIPHDLHGRRVSQAVVSPNEDTTHPVGTAKDIEHMAVSGVLHRVSDDEAAAWVSGDEVDVPPDTPPDLDGGDEQAGPQ